MWAPLALWELQLPADPASTQTLLRFVVPPEKGADAAAAVTAAAAGLIAGGAIGNLVDRLRFGAVTDFIDLHWGAAHWPTFNLADAAIVCGVALLLLTVRGSDSRAASSTLGRAAR